MRRLFCRPPEFLELDTSPAKAKVLACLAMMGPRAAERAVNGNYRSIQQRFARRQDGVDKRSTIEVLRAASAVWTDRQSLAAWCAAFLRATLGTRSVHSSLELEAVIPLLKLADSVLFTNLVPTIEHGLRARYRHGLAQVLRHAGAMVIDEEPRRHTVLLECLLSCSAFGFPRWCLRFFRGLLCRRRAGVQEPDLTPNYLRTLLKDQDVVPDMLRNWVDPETPVSTCSIALWLQHYSSVPALRRGVPDEIGAGKRRPAIAGLLLSMLAQRFRAVASRLDHRSPGTTHVTERTEALLLHIVAEVAYAKGRLPRQLRIAHHLTASLAPEVMLSALGEYRDHLYHAINVASLGLLLDKVGALRRDRTRPLLVRHRLGSWMLASLFHDIGHYAAPYIPVCVKYMVPARVDIGRELRGKLGEEISMFLASVNERATNELGLEVSLACSYNHGILSYEYVRALLHSFKSFQPDRSLTQAWSEALAAIAKHNLDTEVISWRDEPVAVLLVLCDELQDWNRPQWGPGAFAPTVMGAVHFGRRTGLSPPSLCRALRITQSHTARRRNRHVISVQYGSPAQLGYDPCKVIVSKLSNLQRLADCPPLRLVFRFPRTELLRGHGIAAPAPSYRSAMRNFVATLDDPILRHEVLWPDSRHPPPTRWLVDDGEERLCVDLADLHSFRPVLASPQAFSEDFDRFRRQPS